MLAVSFLLFSLKALALVSRSHQQCDDIYPPQHARLKFDDHYLSYKVTCNPGYTLQGKSEVYCENHQWSSPPPYCSEEKNEPVCENPSTPENGYIICDFLPLSVGKKCHFGCHEGYELKGLDKRICMRNLKWSGISPTCISLQSTFCSLPPPLTFGTVVGCSSTKLPRVGESCSYRCNAGYELQGSPTVTCKSNGKYTSSNGDEVFPECVEIFASDHNKDTSFSVNGNADKYTGDSRNRYDIDEDVQKSDPCHGHQCDQLCRVENGRAQCRCNRGFVLNKEDQRTCNVHLGPPIHTTRRPMQTTRRPVQTTKRPSNNPCSHNNGGCSQICAPTNHRQVLCSCRSGFVLQTDRRSCIRESGQKFDTRDPAVTSRPGRPISISSIAVPLDSLEPTSVSLCDISNGGCHHKCDVSEGNVECSCRDGYKFHSNGIHCIDIDECARKELHNCEHGCRNTLGSFKCYCKSGFNLIDGYKCEDVDECANENLNNCHHHCTNTEGSFTCSCNPGYILTDGHKCGGCGKNKFWSFELGGCVDCPKYSHTLAEGSQSIKNCLCDPGFDGSPGDDIPCYDIDECAVNNFGCSYECNNIPGGAYCTCPHGFMLDKDNKTCIDINECSIKNGGCEGECINEHGSFRCICPTGYKASNKDQYSCDDVDECEENNGGCQHKCINFRGGYHCVCENGFLLDHGQKNCIEIQCPALPVPPHSTMECKNNKQMLQEMDYYPINTICRFKCGKGFKNTQNSDTMECQEDGTWIGSLSQCKPQFCDPLKVPENGAVHPASCAKRGNKVKQRCTFSCNPGYVIQGLSIVQCKNDLTWDSKEIPVCQPEKTQSRIECPEDIVATLLPGRKAHLITLSEPNTNLESYEVRPPRIRVGTPIEFPAGVTKVTFIASSSTSNKTARCTTTVTVLDKEPPVFEFCPDPIIIEDAGSNGAFVTWNEPVATDNVEVELLYSLLKPNTTLATGTHVAEYIARDPAGNTASCSFDITIIRMKCPDLNNPEHGQANCVDWIDGKFCQPECDADYMRDPEDPAYYSCDDTGVWEPSDIISECLKFVPLISSKCPDGFEVKTNEETSENVCLQCPSNSIWSTTSRKCEDKK